MTHDDVVGTVELSFPLSDQPPEGEWTVFAEVQGGVFNTTFQVSKYGVLTNLIFCKCLCTLLIFCLSFAEV